MEGGNAPRRSQRLLEKRALQEKAATALARASPPPPPPSSQPGRAPARKRLRKAVSSERAPRKATSRVPDESAARRRTPCLSASPPGTATVADLPSELLLEIFSRLRVEELEAGAARVCLLWRDLVRKPCVRSALTLRSRELGTVVACELLRLSPRLRELRLVERVDADAILRAACRYTRQLQRLSVERCYGMPGRSMLYADVLNRLLRNCARIDELTIEASSLRSNKFCHELAARLPHVRKLNFNYSSILSFDAAGVILQGCSRLESFQALGKRPPNALCITRNVDVITLAGKWQHTLTVLRIDAKNVWDDALSALGQCQLLRDLALRHMQHVTDDGVAQLVKLPRLQALDLMDAKTITARGWFVLLNSCAWKDLQKLNLGLCANVDDLTVHLIKQIFPKLRNLNIAGCQLVNGAVCLLKGSSQIEKLTVCISRTTTSLLNSANLPKLRRFVYHACTKQDSQFKAVVEQRFPNIKVECIMHLNELLKPGINSFNL